MTRQLVTRHPAFVTFDKKWRAQLSAGASALIPSDTVNVQLWVHLDKKCIAIILGTKENNSTTKIYRRPKTAGIRITIGAFYFKQLEIKWEDIKDKRFPIINIPETETLIIDLTTPFF